MMKTIVAAAVFALGPIAAFAQAAPAQQDPAAMLKMLHLAAHNQLGVLEYCRAKGNVGQNVVDIQKRLLGMLPPTQVDGLDAAEALGKSGSVQFGGTTVALADAAKQQNTTIEAMCKQMGAMMEAQAGSLPK